MTAKKKSRQVRRSEERKAAGQTPPEKPLVKIEVNLDEANILAAGLSELPVKVSLDLLNKLGVAMKAALTVPAKARREKRGNK